MDEILRQKDTGLKEAVRGRRAWRAGSGSRTMHASPPVSWRRAMYCAGASTDISEIASPATARSVDRPGNRAVGLPRVHHGGEIARRPLRTHPLRTHYAPVDVVGSRWDYRSLDIPDIGKGDKRRVVGVDHATGTVILEGRSGEAILWQPRRVGGRCGAVEVYRAETIELRADDRICWTRNDGDLGLVNSHTAEVRSVEGGRVSFRLEDGRWRSAKTLRNSVISTMLGPRPFMPSRGAPWTT